MSRLTILCLFFLSAHAMEPYQEQTPLKMTTPSINKEQPAKWIPLTSNAKETAIKNNSISAMNINELIKTQVQKKMQTLLKPLNDDQDEH